MTAGSHDIVVERNRIEDVPVDRFAISLKTLGHEKLPPLR
jgi:hypothetical protein